LGNCQIKKTAEKSPEYLIVITIFMGYIHFFASGPFKSNYSTRLSTSRPTAANWADKVGSGQIKEFINFYDGF